MPNERLATGNEFLYLKEGISYDVSHEWLLFSDETVPVPRFLYYRSNCSCLIGIDGHRFRKVI